MELRTPYRDRKDRAKGYENLEEYFFKEEEITFSKKNDNPAKIKEEFLSKRKNNRRVWLLFARRENHSWESLQVAQSKNNAISEIEDVISFLFCEFNPDPEHISFSDSAFYENVCPKDTNEKDKRKLLYSKIGSEYEYFRICFLDVDKYLGTRPNSSTNKTDVERIIEICKNQYAEAKIAFETLAVYWNLYSSGIDGQTIAYIADHTSEFQE